MRPQPLLLQPLLRRWQGQQATPGPPAQRAPRELAGGGGRMLLASIAKSNAQRAEFGNACTRLASKKEERLYRATQPPPDQREAAVWATL
mmetsp:Transcript_76163/g.181215  ORF Transcript_76163/g.181215 Transcript_76163/m.181215 type:complete len:90 (-) Transcript_76163:234-503(-)